MPRKPKKGQGGAQQVWRYQAVNTITGEVVELADEEAKRQRWPDDHVRVFQERIIAIATEGTLRREEWRVLGYLFGVLQWDNWLVVPQVHIADTLRMQASNVSRAIRELLRRNILVQAHPPAPRTAYRLNAEVAYKGQFTGWYKRRREETQEQERAMGARRAYDRHVVYNDAGTS